MMPSIASKILTTTTKTTMRTFSSTPAPQATINQAIRVRLPAATHHHPHIQ